MLPVNLMKEHLTKKKKRKTYLVIHRLRKINWVLIEGWILTNKDKALLTKCRQGGAQ